MSERTEHQALKEALPAIEAAANGKRVRWVEIDTGKTGEWDSSIYHRKWINSTVRWEIEPEPKTRALTADEALDELWLRIIKRKSDGARFGVYLTSTRYAMIDGPNGGCCMTYAGLHADFTYEFGDVIGKPV